MGDRESWKENRKHWAAHTLTVQLSAMWGLLWLITSEPAPHQLCIRFQIGAATCAADTVDTGEVNCYHFTVRLRSLPRFAETISQGVLHCSAAQRPLVCEDGCIQQHMFYQLCIIQYMLKYWETLKLIC